MNKFLQKVIDFIKDAPDDVVCQVLPYVIVVGRIIADKTKNPVDDLVVEALSALVDILCNPSS